MPYVFRLTGVPHADEWEAAVGFRCGAKPLQHAGSGYGIIMYHMRLCRQWKGWCWCARALWRW